MVGIAQGGREAGVRARVVERQIVRHLTHLIPYLTPSPVTTLIHPFLCYQLSSNVSPYTLTSLSLFLFLFTPRAAWSATSSSSSSSSSSTPSRTPFLSTAPAVPPPRKL